MAFVVNPSRKPNFWAEVEGRAAKKPAKVKETKAPAKKPKKKGGKK